ncbi:hypothetical protein GCM10023184_25810 [Flaviaesturariibacter amylovorans]|uniref:Uncharacterized protein n=1 Tax=Flaviaesturariibacter amylovorans TaxID=1084520 RepID=A0ABP8H148_9BACT
MVEQHDPHLVDADAGTEVAGELGGDAVDEPVLAPFRLNEGQRQAQQDKQGEDNRT